MGRATPFRGFRSRGSRILDSYLLRNFLSTFLVSLLFFVLVIEMIDVFMNIVKYLQNETPIRDILRTMLLYLPTCISFSLPIALLFGASYTMGTFYACNELIVVYASGISLASFFRPVVLSCCLVAAASLAFEDRVVLPTSIQKKAMSRAFAKGGQRPATRTDVTILGEAGRFVWNVSLYDDESKVMTGVTIIERDGEGRFVSRVNAQQGEWTGSYWKLLGVRRFFRAEGDLSEESLETFTDPRLTEPPESFRGGNKPVSEMTIAEARSHLEFLRRSGLPAELVEAEYYKRFSFALTPIVVVLLAAALAGRFRKNVLLMSLLLSVLSATVFYVVQMVSMIFAKNGMIPSFMGGFAPVLLFSLIAAAGIVVRRS